MSNEIKSENWLYGVKVWVRGDENYVRTKTADLLEDMSLKYGYGIYCMVKPQQDQTRTDGSWVAELCHARSCD